MKKVIIKYYCDICNKQLKKKLTNKLLIFSKIIFSLVTGCDYVEKTVFCCNDCYKSFKKWKHKRRTGV